MAELRGFVAAEGVVLDLKIMLGKGTLVGNYVGSEEVRADNRCTIDALE